MKASALFFVTIFTLLAPLQSVHADAIQPSLKDWSPETILAPIPTGTAASSQSSPAPASMSASAPTPCPPSPDGSIYCFLVPLTGTPTIDFGSPTALTAYLQQLFAVMISIGGVILILSIIYAGFQYIWAGTTIFGISNVGGVAAAKERLTNAAVGIAIVLGAYLIVNVVNPDILRKGFVIGPIDVSGGGIQFTATNPTYYNPFTQNNPYGYQYPSGSNGNLVPINGSEPNVTISGIPSNDIPTGPVTVPSADNSSTPVNNGESADRAMLAKNNNPITVNPYPGTILEGTGQSAFIKVEKLANACTGCTINISGAREEGHATHGNNNNIIDLSANSTLTEFLRSKAQGVTNVQITSGQATEYLMPNGDVYRLENNMKNGAVVSGQHFHVIYNNNPSSF